MFRLRKNDIWIGLTISVLLSLFVNFTLLNRKYEMGAGVAIVGAQPPDRVIYYLLVWFFLFSFVLFIASRLMFNVSDLLFRRREYPRVTLVCVVCLGIAFGMFRLAPLLYTPFAGWAETEWNFLDACEGIRPMPGTGDDRTFPLGKPFPSPPPHEPFTAPVLFWGEHLFIFLTVTLSSILIRLLNMKQQMRLENERLRAERWQNSYNALMGQINPHFFFNSLNGLGTLIQSGEQQRTLRYLDELSNVFRYILQSDRKGLVTLAEELQFVKAYTYLLSVRYEGKLFFSMRVDTPLLLWYLPILSVLPLVENAVKHNVISRQSPLRVDIYTSEGNELVVSNNIQPKVEENRGNGIGLKNLWGRYRMLTGKDLQISNQKGYFKVALPLINHLDHT